MEVNSLGSIQKAIQSKDPSKIDMGELRELCYIIRDRALSMKRIQFNMMDEEGLELYQIQKRLEILYEQLTGLKIEEIIK